MEFNCAGGGGSRVQYVLFLKRDGTPVMGISAYSHDGACASSAAVGFYENMGGKWTDVTARVMPALEQAMLLKKNYDTGIYTGKVLSILQKYSKVACDLPRYGLKANIRYEFIYAGPCRESRLEESERPVMKELEPNDVFRPREMEWNPKSGTFKLLD